MADSGENREIRSRVNAKQAVIVRAEKKMLAKEAWSAKTAKKTSSRKPPKQKKASNAKP